MPNYKDICEEYGFEDASLNQEEGERAVLTLNVPFFSVEQVGTIQELVIAMREYFAGEEIVVVIAGSELQFGYRVTEEGLSILSGHMSEAAYEMLYGVGAAVVVGGSAEGAGEGWGGSLENDGLEAGCAHGGGGFSGESTPKHSGAGFEEGGW
ncbi:MAG: hypothetical protein RLN62_04245 [Rickettsiales bacterium]